VVFRRLAAVAAVSLLLLGLASCRSDPSTAAYVGNEQISIDQVDSFYAKAAADPISAQLVSQQPSQIKPALVSMLVYLSLLRDSAAANKVSVSAGQIAQVKEAVEPQRSQLSDARLLLPVDQLAELQTYQVVMSDWARKATADETAANKRYSDALQTSLKSNPVTVNPRFGKFDLNNVPAMTSADVAVTPAPSASAAS
jgi:hypothetical protein